MFGIGALFVLFAFVGRLESGFLQRDESMWTYYRWDISSYPPCNGSLDYEDLLPKPIRPHTAPSIDEIQ